MDLWTLEELVDTGNTLGIMIGIVVGLGATTLAGMAATGKISRRLYLVSKYMPHYKNGLLEEKPDVYLKVKPNIFNIRRITSTDPEYKNKYWVRRKE